MSIANQAQGMKRSENTYPSTTIRAEKIQKTPLDPFVLQKQKHLPNSPEFLFLSKIQSHIYGNFDPTEMSKLLWQSQGPLLDQEDRDKLYTEAHDLENLLTAMPTPLFHANLITKKNYLYAFKFLPQLTLPQAFFTPVPYKRLSDKRPNLDQIIEALVRNEQEKIYVCCYHFKAKSLAESLFNQKNKGVSIEIIANQSQGKPEDWWILTNLKNNNIPVFSPQNDKFEQMHHKFFIFKKNLLNKSLLVVGSYNPTPYGNTSSWDDIIILDDQKLIGQYIERFETIKERSK